MSWLACGGGAMRRPWTDADKARFAAYWEAGRPVHWIAEALDRTERTIRAYRVVLGLTPRNWRSSRVHTYVDWTPAADRKLGRLFRAGFTDPELATELKRTRWAIQTRRQKLGLLKGPHKAVSAADQKEWQAMQKSGLSFWTIARKVRRSYSTIRKYLEAA